MVFVSDLQNQRASLWMRDLEEGSPRTLASRFLDPDMPIALSRFKNAGPKLLTLCTVSPDEAEPLFEALSRAHGVDPIRLLPPLAMASYFIAGLKQKEREYNQEIMREEALPYFLSAVIETTKPGGKKPVNLLYKADSGNPEDFDRSRYEENQYDALSDIETTDTLRKLVITKTASSIKLDWLKSLEATLDIGSSLHAERLIVPMIKETRTQIKQQVRMANSANDVLAAPASSVRRVSESLGRRNRIRVMPQV